MRTALCLRRRAGTGVRPLASSAFALVILGTTADLLHAAPFAYVASGGNRTVSVIDVATSRLVARVQLPPGTYPMQLAATPDGSRVYVSNNTGSGTVSVIETSTNRVLVPTIAVGNGPRGLTVSRDGRFVYVANQFSNTVSVIETTGNTVRATIPVGYQPTDVGVTPDGSRLYVAHSMDSAVLVLDAATYERIGAVATTGSNAQALAMSRDGSTVYVSHFNSRSVSVIDTGVNALRATIPVGDFPLGLDASEIGGRLYVADSDPALNNGSVAVIDTATGVVAARLTLPRWHTSRHVAITPDGTRGVVTINTPQRVLVFDTATNLLTGDAVSVDGIPEGVAIADPRPFIETPDVLEPTAVSANYVVRFSASGGSGYTWSVVAGLALPPGMTLASTGVVEGRPTVAGTYSFRIRVTDSTGGCAERDFTLTVEPFHRHFAEGAATWFFDCYFALVNPSATTTASVTLTFLRDDSQTFVYTEQVPPLSRRTVNAKNVPGITPAYGFSTILESNIEVVADRTMSWDALGMAAMRKPRSRSRPRPGTWRKAPRRTASSSTT